MSMDVKGKRVLVCGMARSGIAAANMFAAIVNMDLDDLIDTMQPVPCAEKAEISTIKDMMNHKKYIR